MANQHSKGKAAFDPLILSIPVVVCHPTMCRAGDAGIWGLDHVCELIFLRQIGSFLLLLPWGKTWHQQ